MSRCYNRIDSNYINFIKYLNKHVGEVLTKVDHDCDMYGMSEALMSHYRHLLKSACYMIYVDKSKYKLMKKIPLDLTVNKLNEMRSIKNGKS